MEHPASSNTSEIPVGLREHFYRQAPRYGAGLLLLATYQVGQYWFNVTLSHAIDAGSGANYSRALHSGLMLIAISVVAFVVRILSRMTMFNAGRIAEYELRKALLDHLQHLGPGFYSGMRTGDIMSRFTNDLGQVRLLLGFGVLNVINSIFGLLSALTFMLAVSWNLTLAAFTILPLILLVMRGFMKGLYDRQRENQQGIGELSDRVQSSVAGARVVRAFGLEQAEQAAFDRVNERYLEKSLRLARLRGALWPLVASVTALGVVVMFWYGGSLLLRGDITQGQFLAFYNALAQLSWPLISVGFLLGVLQRGRAGYSRLAEVFAAKPDIVDGAKTLEQVEHPALQVRNLSFNHGDTSILKQVSFELPASSSLAIVGRTGSGKTTLAVLLARLRAVPHGAIFLNGVDVCDLPVRQVREVIGYAEQDAFLFSTTVARNIGYALEEPDSKESEQIIHQAAAETQILNEAQELPDGFDTVVGERGVQLSGGQAQRVALARALVSRPKILILDDPLSAVDARTERAILHALDRERARRSVILITHRVSAAATCDRVLVLDHGAVLDIGTHAELLKRCDVYAAFAEEQRIQSELSAIGGSVDAVGAVAQ
ncbi:MAG TPA: ABC transporter ATP-binding protein [Polyangiaceae bacterium]|nr:ABC transporter ATP-binding protein [Polyangiaceae bacterium]